VATEYKKVPRRDTYDSHSSNDPPVTVPFSFPPFSLLLSRFWSVQVSVSLYYCNHHVCEDLCWVSRARLCRLSAPCRFFPFFITGGSAAADSDFVFYVSNLSWNTNDDTLRQVRLIFFGSACVICS
jgi:hypothetical protein